MALIKCPECGKDISDMSNICVNCGFPLQDYLNKKKQEEHEMEIEKERFRCKCCGFQNKIGNDYCDECGMRITEYNINIRNSLLLKEPDTVDNKDFDGIYRYTLFGKKQEVYCPRCGSSDCSHYQEQMVIPEKTKTRYNANLNPLHPFTLVNKKEKVVRKEQIVTESKFICNSCGKIFN